MFFLSVVDISFSVYVLHLKQVIHVEIIKHIFDHTEKKMVSSFATLNVGVGG